MDTAATLLAAAIAAPIGISGHPATPAADPAPQVIAPRFAAPAIPNRSDMRLTLNPQPLPPRPNLPRPPRRIGVA